MSDEIDPEDHEVDDVSYDTELNNAETASDVELFGTQPDAPDVHEGTEGVE